jgi:hypothetical protein
VRAGTAGAAGDLTIYAPWGNLAIFYRGFTYTDDLIRLGSLEPGAATAISELEDGPPSPSRVPTETTLGAGGKFEERPGICDLADPADRGLPARHDLQAVRRGRASRRRCAPGSSGCWTR